MLFSLKKFKISVRELCGEVVISGIMEVSLAPATYTLTLLIPDITTNSSNSCYNFSSRAFKYSPKLLSASWISRIFAGSLLEKENFAHAKRKKLVWITLGTLGSGIWPKNRLGNGVGTCTPPSHPLLHDPHGQFSHACIYENCTIGFWLLAPSSLWIESQAHHPVCVVTACQYDYSRQVSLLIANVII